jgi:hypothetical protein
MEEDDGDDDAVSIKICAFVGNYVAFSDKSLQKIRENTLENGAEKSVNIMTIRFVILQNAHILSTSRRRPDILLFTQFFVTDSNSIPRCFTTRQFFILCTRLLQNRYARPTYLIFNKDYIFLSYI